MTTPPRRPARVRAAVTDIDRRGVLRGFSLAALALGTPSVLAACGTESQVQSAETCESTDKSETEKTLTFSNWPEYMDVEGNRMPTLDRFEKQTGIEVTYDTDINDNNDFFGKVKDQLGSCEPIGRDIIVMTDSTAARMINLGWMQQLDKSNLPNVEANLLESLRSPAWDAEREYSVPWQAGLTGIAYNKRYTDPVSSFEELLTRDDLKGRIGLLTEMEDTMGFMLKVTGADTVGFTQEQWDAAVDRLAEVVASGQVRRFHGNDYIRDLRSGNLVACLAWSGDVAASEAPALEFTAPEEGLHIWSDNMLVPNRAEHKANAEALMNYYYDPEVAAELAAWVWFICPVEGAQEAMEKIDPDLVDNDLIFPSEEFLANTFSFDVMDEATRQQYEKDFSRAIGG